ncbi:calcium-binding protein [Vibrio mytili]|uniref:calcium-binding protein n=1 Tax=Vibrio mytili TaxID=50718 RepID=UPI002F405FA2
MSLYDDIDNVIVGSNDSDDLSNFSGDNEMFIGLGGDDKIVGGGGNDILIGGKGDDKLIGGAGNDILRGGDGNDILKGGSGEDILLGLSGDNILNGGTGGDVLVAGSGDNFLVGGADTDLFIFTDLFGGHGTATVADFTIGEDMIRISSSTVNDFSDLSFSYDAAGNAVFTDGADLVVKLKGITETDIDTYGADLFVI